MVHHLHDPAQAEASVDLSKRVGNTPLIPLPSVSKDGARLFGKLEWYNPFGSLKDRAAYWMVKEAERVGKLGDGQIIIEPTSGNTGIALVGIGRLLGYRVQTVVPEKISEETKKILRGLGAELLETEDDLCPRVGPGTDQSIALSQSIVKGHPDKYFMPNQYENEANFLAHYEGTGPEVWRDTEGKVTHLVAGIGTGGTITGAGLYLKERNPKVKVHAVEPQKNHHLQGLRNLEESAMPAVLERRYNLIDERITVNDEDAFRMVRTIYEREKLLVGPSSGAAVSAAMEVAAKEKSGLIAVVLPDDGRKYGTVFSEFSTFEPEEFTEIQSKALHLPPQEIPLQNL